MVELLHPVPVCLFLGCQATMQSMGYPYLNSTVCVCVCVCSQIYFYLPPHLPPLPLFIFFSTEYMAGLGHLFFPNPSLEQFFYFKSNADKFSRTLFVDLERWLSLEGHLLPSLMTWVLSPKPTWWKGRSDFCRLSSDPYLHIVAHPTPQK